MQTRSPVPILGLETHGGVCQRNGYNVSNNKTYRIFQLHHLLTKKKPRAAEIYQAAKLFAVLPDGPNKWW